MPVTQTFTDSEGKTWDFAAVNPIGGRFPGQAGQGVVNGTSDAYDGGLALAVGPDVSNPASGALINPAVGSVDENGRELNTGAVIQNGIAVTRSFLVSDASISTVGFCRLLDSFTNTTNQTMTILVQILSDLGSDGSTTVVAETSGNNAIDPGDRGFVTDEVSNQTGGDSSVGYVYGDGLGLTPVAARPSLVSGEGVDEITVQFHLTLQPGETQRLLSFAFQNTTAAEGVADLTLFDDSLAVLDTRGLLAGISAAERAGIVNYSEAGVPPPSLTVKDGTGQGWVVNLANGSLSTEGTTALISTRFAETGSLLASFTDPVSAVLSELGQEATVTFGSTAAGTAGSSVSYSVMASPVENYARMLVTVRAGQALDFSDGLSGLQALFGGSFAVGDRDLATGASNGLVDLLDSGIVVDDSSSGLGGTSPAVSVVFGNYSLGKPVQPGDQVTFGSSTLLAQDDDFKLVAGETASFLFFFSLNGDSGPGLGDLLQLSSPDFQALAGLSAAEVASIRNFTLTEADRVETLVLTAADEQTAGNFWAESIDGQAGDDDLFGGGSGDFLFGGIGDDLLDGGDQNDVLDGGVGQDVLLGREGNDALHGLDGDDLLNGGFGNDSGFGGLGNDTLSGSGGSDRLTGDDGDDVLKGGAGIDTLTGGIGNDTLDGGLGADILNGDTGNDQMFGGGQGDRLSGLAGDDTLFGGNAADLLSGSLGNDRLFGETGVDSLLGGAGDDTLDGGSNGDTLTGGNGVDVLIGGANGDVFDFNTAGEAGVGALRDIINDFISLVDVIDLSGLGALTFINTAAFGNVAGQVRQNAAGGSTLIQIDLDGNGNAEFEIALLGISGIQASDLIL